MVLIAISTISSFYNGKAPNPSWFAGCPGSMSTKMDRMGYLFIFGALLEIREFQVPEPRIPGLGIGLFPRPCSCQESLGENSSLFNGSLITKPGAFDKAGNC